MHTKDRLARLRMETTLAVLGDDRRYLIECSLVNATSYVEHHLTTGTAIGWLIPVVSALGTNGRADAIRWVRYSLESLISLTEDEWMRDRMSRELQFIATFDTQPPSRAVLEKRSDELHQIPHEGAQPPVHNLLLAYANSEFRDDNQFVVNLEASLRLILEAAGNSTENRKIVIAHLRTLARSSSVDLDSYQLQRDR